MRSYCASARSRARRWESLPRRAIRCVERDDAPRRDRFRSTTAQSPDELHHLDGREDRNHPTWEEPQEGEAQGLLQHGFEYRGTALACRVGADWEPVQRACDVGERVAGRAEDAPLGCYPPGPRLAGSRRRRPMDRLYRSRDDRMLAGVAGSRDRARSWSSTRRRTTRSRPSTSRGARAAPCRRARGRRARRFGT
jgi:hypothetical protein